MTTYLKQSTFFVFLLWVFLIPRESIGDIYKWVDEDGKVHYTDQPPAQLQGDAEVINIPASQGAATSEFPAVKRDLPIAKPGETDAKSVRLEHVSFDYEGKKTGEDITVGKSYIYTKAAEKTASQLSRSGKTLTSALKCLPGGKLKLNNASYIRILFRPSL